MGAAEEIQDRFKIWADRTFQQASGPGLLKVGQRAGMAVTLFSKSLGLPRTNLYHDRVKVDAKLRTRLLDLTRIMDNAYTLFSGDEEKALEWLFKPNRRFYNFSPFHMAMAGQGSAVFEHQEEIIKPD